MIILDDLPFKFVDREGFKQFCQELQPRFRLPSRPTLTRDCYALFLAEKKNLKDFFKKLSSRVCLTTNTWTSIQNLNYMCLTAHFIYDNWTLHKKIINFCPITSHAGEVIGTAVKNCLLE
ncbi:hypothetical protein ACH5RR_005057 [Cinchona calisaya]|uniref:Transposase n=1 Tax=Cinchona calisaya TaxID=153742 RepID=A0ABD3AZI1_9GENT